MVAITRILKHRGGTTNSEISNDLLQLKSTDPILVELLDIRHTDVTPAAIVLPKVEMDVDNEEMYITNPRTPRNTSALGTTKIEQTVQEKETVREILAQLRAFEQEKYPEL